MNAAQKSMPLGLPATPSQGDAAQTATNAAPLRAATIQDLRGLVAALEGKETRLLEGAEAVNPARQEAQPTPQQQPQTPPQQQRLALGCPAIDQTLDGGLASDALHEIFPKRAEWDDGLTSAFALALLAHLQQHPLGQMTGQKLGEVPQARAVVWITQKDTAGATLSPQGLMALGFNPDALIQIQVNSDSDALWAFEEVLSHPDIGAIVGEICALDLAQSHRLHLRASETATANRFRLLLALRRHKGARQPQANPTSAATRWRLGPVAPHLVAANGASQSAYTASHPPASSHACMPQLHEQSAPYIGLPKHTQRNFTPSSTQAAPAHSTNNLAGIEGASDTGRSHLQPVTALTPKRPQDSQNRARWAAQLFRNRGGAPGEWLLQWSYEHRQFNQLAKLATTASA